jgi:hypothetical protein
VFCTCVISSACGVCRLLSYPRVDTDIFGHVDPSHSSVACSVFTCGRLALIPVPCVGATTAIAQ